MRYALSEITQPKDDFDAIKSVGVNCISDFLNLLSIWRTEHKIQDRGNYSTAWYRGHSRTSYNLEPGVCRTEFTKRAMEIYDKANTEEENRLHLERELLKDFRTKGARFFDPEEFIPVYFTAQHYGMPTRLLDWTSNPLAALYFATKNESEDGYIYVMEPSKLLPPPPSSPNDDFPVYIVTMRHPYVEDAIRESFFYPPKKSRRSLYHTFASRQPTRKDQSAKFVLHIAHVPVRSNFQFNACTY